VQQLQASRRFLPKMRSILPFTAICFSLFWGASSALAFQPAGVDTALPTQHQLDLRYSDNQTQPYAMNYTDEAAQSLGIHDGQWVAFDSHPGDGMLPSIKGGVDKGSAMFKLQWTPGR
jgi:hypothetical protein